MARIDGSKRARNRNRRSEKRKKRKAPKTTAVSRTRTSETCLVTQRDAAPASAPEPTPALELASTPEPTPALELEDAFFSQPPPPMPSDPLALAELEGEAPHAAPVLTAGQAARRRWFRRRVQHLMAGLTAFTGFAALVHIAQLG